jgi:hypothetical protein
VDKLGGIFSEILLELKINFLNCFDGNNKQKIVIEDKGN